jgi:hypothetical protein
VRLTTSLQVGEKYLGCVVCRFHVASDTGSAPCQKPVSINLQKWFLSSTGRLNLGFILRENLLLCSLYLPIGVPNWWSILRTNKLFLAPLPGRKRISARGVSHFQSFYVVIVLLSFFTLFLFASCLSKIQKKLVPPSSCSYVLSSFYHYVAWGSDLHLQAKEWREF